MFRKKNLRIILEIKIFFLFAITNQYKENDHRSFIIYNDTKQNTKTFHCCDEQF